MNTWLRAENNMPPYHYAGIVFEENGSARTMTTGLLLGFDINQRTTFLTMFWGVTCLRSEQELVRYDIISIGLRSSLI